MHIEDKDKVVGLEHQDKKNELFYIIILIAIRKSMNVD